MGCIGVFLLLLAGYYVFGWPYLLGSYLAVQGGAAVGSSTANFVGWLLEILYLLLLAGLVVGAWIRRRTAAAAHVAAQEAAKESERVRSLQAERERSIRDAQLGLSAIRDLWNAIQTAPGGTQIDGAVGEQRLYYVDDAELIAYRVAYRNGPRQPTVIDHGRLTFTNRHVKFRGSRDVEWLLSAVQEIAQEDGFITMRVKGRKTVYGFGADTNTYPLIPLALEWSLAVRLDKPLGDVRAAVERQLATADAKLHRALAT